MKVDEEVVSPDLKTRVTIWNDGIRSIKDLALKIGKAADEADQLIESPRDTIQAGATLGQIQTDAEEIERHVRTLIWGDTK